MLCAQLPLGGKVLSRVYVVLVRTSQGVLYQAGLIKRLMRREFGRKDRIAETAPIEMQPVGKWIVNRHIPHARKQRFRAAFIAPDSQLVSGGAHSPASVPASLRRPDQLSLWMSRTVRTGQGAPATTL
jgi:hypothetical protein